MSNLSFHMFKFCVCVNKIEEKFSGILICNRNFEMRMASKFRETHIIFTIVFLGQGFGMTAADDETDNIITKCILSKHDAHSMLFESICTGSRIRYFEWALPRFQSSQKKQRRKKLAPKQCSKQFDRNVFDSSKFDDQNIFGK